MNEDAKNANPVVLKKEYSLLGIRRFKQLRRLLKSLKGGTSMDAACKNTGIDVSTFWRWRQASPRLANLAYEIVDSRVLVMEDSLYNQGIKGNVKAIEDFLYNRAPQRWKPHAAIVQNVNVINNGEKTDKFQEAPRFVFKDAKDV